MKLRLSHSSIQDFQRCPRRWYLKWIERIGAVERVGSRPLDFGNAFHKGQEVWWTSDSEPTDRLRAAHEAFNAAAAELSWEDRVLGPELLTGYAVCYGSDELRFQSVPIAERKVVLPVLDPDGQPCDDLEYTVVFDVVGYDPDGNTVLVEHKTSASDITTAKFWSRFERSLQLPLQVLAAVDAGRAPQKLVLDAVRAPIVHRRLATPIEKREFYVRATGSAKVGDPKPGTRLRDESREECEQRIREGLLENPLEYYQRREYTFDAHSLDMARLDLYAVGQQMLDVVRRGGMTPRNPAGCSVYGANDSCEYEPACWRGESLRDEALYTVRARR